MKNSGSASLLAHERSRFANCRWELLTPTDISIPLTNRLVLDTLEAGDCLFCVQFIEVPEIYGNVCGDKNCFSLNVIKFPMRTDKAWNFLKDRAFYQSKCDKNSYKGRENMRILEKTVLFLSLNVTKIPIRAEKT